MIETTSAAANALLKERNAAVSQCRSLRPAQSRARDELRKAEAAVKDAKAAYEHATSHVSDAMDQMRQLEEVYERLTGQPMSRRPDVY